jgi:hypothetical protein
LLPESRRKTFKSVLLVLQRQCYDTLHNISEQGVFKILSVITCHS